MSRWSGFFIQLVGFAVALCSLPACNDVATRMPNGGPANSALEEVKKKFPSASVAYEQRDAFGVLDHLIVRIPSEGKASNLVAITDKGAVMPLDEAQYYFAMRHQSEWGAIGLQSAAEIIRLGGDERLRFLAILDDDPGLAAELGGLIESYNVVGTWIQSPPSVLFWARPFEARTIARHPSVLKMVLGGAMDLASAHTPSPHPSPAIATKSHDSYNTHGRSAAGIKVGVMESSPRCEIWDSHEAFANLSGLTYRWPSSVSCISDGNCNCGHGGFASKCINGTCVDYHTHSVASRIASSQGGVPYHAASVDLFIANVFEVGTDPVHNRILRSWPEAISSGYEWLNGRGVRLVNESFMQQEFGFSSRHLISDWFARYRGMTLVQAAGNLLPNFTADGEVRCGGLNTICVGGFTHETDKTTKFSSNSLWKNYYSSSGSALEIEKPDLIAEADRDYADIYSEDAWVEVYPGGTSLAAPEVVGVLALFQEDCAMRRGIDLLAEPLGVRARLRTGMRHSNPIEKKLAFQPCRGLFSPRCPTAQYGFCDYRSGVGPVDSEDLLIWCNPPCSEGDFVGPCALTESLELSPDDPGREDVPAWMRDDIPWSELPIRGSALVNRKASSRVRVIHEWEDVPLGTRFRSTLSYHSCPAGARDHFAGQKNIRLNPSDLSTAVNFDLVICGHAKGDRDPKCLFQSESLHDTNEGFHVSTKEEFDWIRIYLVEPDQWAPCASESGAPGRREPAFVATIYGRGF